jgi:hypothetical protein
MAKVSQGAAGAEATGQPEATAAPSTEKAEATGQPEATAARSKSGIHKGPLEGRMPLNTEGPIQALRAH